MIGGKDRNKKKRMQVKNGGDRLGRYGVVDDKG